jgi:hypothetical protein
MVMVHAMEAYA